MTSFLDYCLANHDWLLELIETLVAIESPSDDPAAVNRCGDELTARLEAIGGQITRVRHRPAPAITSAPVLAPARDRSSCSGISTPCGPSASSRACRSSASGGSLHGPGVFDMKAGIGLAMLATRAVLEQQAPGDSRIVMLWTTDEEIGSKTSRALIEAEATKSDAVLVFEPSLPGGALKTSRKGVGQFEMIARGVSAHAGLDPGKGVSAVRELARQIVAIDDLQDPAQRRDADGRHRLGRHAGECRARRSPGDDRRARDHARGRRSRAAHDAVAAAVSSRRNSGSDAAVSIARRSSGPRPSSACSSRRSPSPLKSASI